MTRTIERPQPALPIVEDITRRSFLVGGSGMHALGLAGCGSESREAASGETRRVEGYYGSMELPVEPRRLVPGYTSAMDYEADAEEYAEDRRRLTSSPLWDRLYAVKEDRAFEAGSHWHGYGPLAADLVLDDIEAALEEVSGDR